MLTFTEGSNVDADIIIKSFDGDGNPTSSEVQVNTTSYHTQMASEIAKLSDGNYVVVWEATMARTVTGSVFLRRSSTKI